MANFGDVSALRNAELLSRAKRQTRRLAQLCVHKQMQSAPQDSERLDIGLRAQAGEPVFLQLLRLFLTQPPFDLSPQFLA